jgi:hypothetical protein
MKNIFVLPTDKPSRLVKIKDTFFLTSTDDIPGGTFYNIYITSNEEISGLENNIWVYNNGRVWLWENTMALRSNNKPKKIILTTDQDLIKDGVQTIDDEFLEWFVNNPSCEEVEVEKDKHLFCSHCNELHSSFSDGVNCDVCRKQSQPYLKIFRYKIIIPQEELKTSHQWQLTYPDPVVMDPDGWDRKNYQYSWFEEKITLAEYNRRMLMSTCVIFTPKEEPKQYPIGGYAPGNYYCNCITCKQQFFGDKRAVQCEPCAIEMVNAEIDINKEGGVEETKPEPNFYEKLKEYFETTPREKVLEDWNKSAHLDNVGPAVDEFIENSNEERLKETAKRLYEYQSQNPPYTIITPKAKIEGFIEGVKSDVARDYWFEKFEEDLRTAYFSGIKTTGEGRNGEYVNGNNPSIEEEFQEEFQEWFEQYKKK